MPWNGEESRYSAIAERHCQSRMLRLHRGCSGRRPARPLMDEIVVRHLLQFPGVVPEAQKGCRIGG